MYSLLQLPLEKEMEEKFAERCRYHAKRPAQAFAEEQKETETPSFSEPALSLYRQLQTLNRNRLSPL
jgi:hypothetical protein